MSTLASILRASARDLQHEQLAGDVIAFLREHAVPQELIDDFSDAAYSEWISVASLSVMPMNRLKIENTEGPNAPCIAAGFLILAGGLNGDPIAVNVHDHQMAYIFHDELWESEDPSILDCMVRTGMVYDEFWQAAAADASFPVDAYDAADRWGRPGQRMA